ncbi:MAG: L-rhamnose mutarotase [Bacteroidota bacterium]|nr:L-rhamnose mutarotase [Bacteroidota bacterium]
MERIAFRMQLKKGNETEYRKRHQEIWPELRNLLKDTGITEYSIFLEPESLQLFGFLKIRDAARLDKLPDEPMMKKWWTYMKDLMECHDNHAPISLPLQEVFYLP